MLGQGTEREEPFMGLVRLMSPGAGILGVRVSPALGVCFFVKGGRGKEEN